MSASLSRWTFIAAFVMGLGLLFLKYQVASLEQTRAQLDAALRKTREHIHILHAERTHITEPQRLHKLACRHLKTWGPIHLNHILTMDQVPWRGRSQSKALEQIR